MSKKHPAPTREHHDQFCETEGWTIVRGATGRPVRHHRTYELTLWDGRILRTRISKPVDKTAYGPRLWAHILREQLEVPADAFWSCVLDGRPPQRNLHTRTSEKKAVPLHLIRALKQFGVAEDEILALDAAGAAELLASLYAAVEAPTNP